MVVSNKIMTRGNYKYYVASPDKFTRRNNNYTLLIMYILGDLLKVVIHCVSLFDVTQVMAARTKYVKEWKKRKRMVCSIFNLHKKIVISE